MSSLPSRVYDQTVGVDNQYDLSILVRQMGTQGLPGPNIVNSSTATTFNGIIYGNGSTFATVQIGTGLSFVNGVLTNTGAASAVTSVAGRTGAVVLTNSDIGGLGSLATLNAAPAGTLTGTVLNATVVTSSLTSTGILASGSTATGFNVADASLSSNIPKLNAANTFTNANTFAQAASTGSPSPIVTVTGPAHTSLTTTAEVIGVNFNLSATKTWATGNIATQREMVVQGPTYAFAGASTITTANTVSITAPTPGANATFTNAAALQLTANTSATGLTIVSASGSNSLYKSLRILNNVGTDLLYFKDNSNLVVGATGGTGGTINCGVIADFSGNRSTLTLAAEGTPSRAFQIANANAGYIASTIKLADSQTADAFQIITSTGTILSGFTSSGGLYVGGTISATNLSGTNTGDQTITLTGDATGSGTGSFAVTLATVNANVGSFTNANITVDAKGRITAASNGSAGGVTTVFGRSGAVVAQAGDYTPTQVGLGNVTNAAQTLASVVPNTLPSAGQILVGNAGGTAYAPVSVSGDASLASTGSLTISAGAVSLAKMASLAANSLIGNNTGVSATPVALTATQTKTLLAITSSDVSGLGGLATLSAAPAGTLTGATLASGVTVSSLTSFGNSPTLVTPVLGTPTSGTLTNCTGYTTANLSGTITNAQLAGSIANSKLGGTVTNKVVTCVMGDGTNVPAVGTKAYVFVPYAGTITRVTLMSTTSGSAVIDIWKSAYATTFPPTVANTITASALPTLSSATKYQDSTLTGWTTSVAAGDVILFNLNSVTTCTKLVLELEITLS